MTTNKLICDQCDWQGTDDQILTAPNPFDASDTLSGCPKCKSVDMLRGACEHDGCWLAVSCGTPTESGYAQTCGKHAPKPHYSTARRGSDAKD